ncbi:hypothetical protein I4U23_000478 [Adineta vaga]|nr:hypothetical protein I4U23_000478 [Adineta vaga]
MSKDTSKCVAIIGAGVSGLVSAVNMYRVGIQPIVFEKASDLGGMWNSNLRPCWKSMRTNISKFSTALSDYSWPNDTSLFPSQEEVYTYLSNYIQQSLPNDVFRFNTHVTNISRFNNKWKIQLCAQDNSMTVEEFDFVIIASGFFSSPHISDKIMNLSSFPGKIIHSSDYHSSDQVHDKRVIIVGGSMSAAEIAADMATSAKHIIHIVPHRFWSVPRLIPLKSSDPVSCFLPIDFVYNRRSIRTSDEETIIRTTDENKKINQNLRATTGNNQKSSMINDANDEKPALIVISDMYAQWTRAGKIILQEGRLMEIDADGTLKLNNGFRFPTTCNDILILCTGYRPCFDYFSKDILENLSYKSDDLFCPLILHRSVFHPTLPNLAFVGMYRGTFWAIIELQARWVASTFAGLLSLPSITTQQIGLEVEQRIRAQQPRPQFPHSDYVGVLNGLAKEIDLLTSSNSSDIVIPAQYHPNSPDQSVMDEMNRLCEEANSGRFIAGAVFRALHDSTWTFERILIGKPSDGTVHGQAQFLFSQSAELLYKEQGKLTLSSQIPLDITQKYIYNYDEKNDVLTVYFVNENNQRASLFHKIDFQPKQTSSTSWIATGEHLCSQDHYSVSYSFAFNGINLSQFQITYTVKGPAKDYVSKTIFQPKTNYE